MNIHIFMKDKMEKYIDFVFDQNETMPPCEEDILRISRLHSWYKHLVGGVKAYPLLLQGEEPRYSFDTRFTDPNKKNFHWRIIMDYHMNDYGIMIENNGIYVQIPEKLKDLMKKFPIALDENFLPFDIEKSIMQRKECAIQCEKFWKELCILKIQMVNE